ncbi:uncharacterized protein PHACADRAFT_249026 [Phanerochaete carnosa HHB-10118-sp]|uniref:Uncharacterized protein n=1 Tax=Phanerochaete carnosa (strain HHB-10118-sp) TaxID=650164 RepID=K5WII3_PHACS|nr:uncharacterized protein PHACADRAFT_249026 [Phanerochaete carnosa HHB-10118-sp]EKM58909.1 hypothetical protein PHACADRAFT_249026 [Phanerochaete carnosa HHB-10118-sp]
MHTLARHATTILTLALAVLLHLVIDGRLECIFGRGVAALRISYSHNAPRSL